jgi:hypothetical protein
MLSHVRGVAVFPGNRRVTRRPFCQQTQDPSVQFSITNLETLANSRVLLVTNVKPRLRAWAAMNRSFAPIMLPSLLRSARMRA